MFLPVLAKRAAHLYAVAVAGIRDEAMKEKKAKRDKPRGKKAAASS